MNMLEVYALNIQPRQIIARIKCQLSDKNAIEYERNNFLKFLQKMAESGRVYFNQMDAWVDYDNRELPEVYEPEDEFLTEFDIEPYEDRALAQAERDSWLDQKTPDWINRLRYMLIEQALKNSGNYNEFGGQL